MPLALRTEWSMGFSATGNAQIMKGSPNWKSGQQHLLSLDRPRANEILIRHTQHAQQEFFAAASQTNATTRP